MKRILLIILIFTLLSSCSDNEKAVHDLSVIPSIIEFEHTESTRKIYITSNILWLVSSNQDWCKAYTVEKFGNDSVEIKVSENATYNERIAYISINNSEKTIIKTVKVTQKSLGRQARYDDSIALVKFYNSMGGDEWTNNSGWKTSNLEDWYGVVIKNYRVTGIKFENNNLSGELIPELGDLSMLDTFSIISEKGVTGSIPVSITNLSDLQYLNISETSISGNIPSGITALTNLKHLILSNNSILGTIPEELANLELLTLHLENNYLSGRIPDRILDKIDDNFYKVCPQKYDFSPFNNYTCE